MEFMKNFKWIFLIALAFIIILGAGYYTYSQNTNNTIPDNSINSSPQTSYPKPFPLHRAELSTFLNAIEAADLGGLFKGTGLFTGFIPTNEAFEKLGKGKWEKLLKPENKDQLTAILTYHMVPGKYKADFLKTTQLKTINGKYLDINVQDKEIKVNNAKILQANLEGPNWIVHEI